MNNPFVVTEYHADMRLDLFLSHQLTEASRSRIQSAIAEGAVVVNGKEGKKSTILCAGDSVEVKDYSLFLPPAEEAPAVAEEMDLDIIYEDDWYIAINKPAGVVVHPGSGNPVGTILNGVLYYLKDGDGTPRLVHRLDKDTSGVLLIGKNAEAHELMSAQFADRQVYKGYLGVAIGRYPNSSGSITAPLGRSKSDPVKRTVREDGRDARTDYLLLRYRSGVSALAYHIHTGRTHQIRVHSAYSGFPILADDVYRGSKSQVKLLEPMERPFAYKMYTRFFRQALHSRYLSFTHPYTGDKVVITAPLPQDFQKAFEDLDIAAEEMDVFETPRMDSVE